MLTDCVAGKHLLVEIYRDSNYIDDRVVRWCSYCGSVVVDIEYDGRINPGGERKMEACDLYYQALNYE
jgi:hypothetical protein